VTPVANICIHCGTACPTCSQDEATRLSTWTDEAMREMTADRDRWRREFEAAAKYVEENARLHCENRRLERALAGGVGPLADSDASARDSEEGCGAMASSGNRIPHG
jgi:hypothetical protein